MDKFVDDCTPFLANIVNLIYIGLSEEVAINDEVTIRWVSLSKK